MLIRNTSLQFIGRASALVAGFIGIPIYLSYLGAENYGLIGVYISLQAFMALFDFGLPLNANRQISFYLAEDKSPQAISSFVRSYELIFLFLGLLVFLGLSAGSHWLVTDWFTLKDISSDQAISALKLAAIAAALRFPVSLYSNILFAHDRHMGANLIITTAHISRVGLSVLLFLYVEPTIEMFFIAQIIVNLAELLFLLLLYWSKNISQLFCLPDWQAAKKTLALSLTLSGISISALFLSQIDKVILTKMLTLKDFGLYSVAYSLAMGMIPLAYAVGNATFPTLTKFIAAQKEEELHQLLKKSHFLIIALMAPPTVFFVTQIDYLELLIHQISDQANLILPLIPFMALGVYFQSHSILPHGFRVAHNKAMAIVWINLCLILPYAILLYFNVQNFGLIGASYSFALTNFGLVLLHWFSLNKSGPWRKFAYQTLLLLILLIIGGYLLTMVIDTDFSPMIKLCLAIFNTALLFLGLVAYIYRTRN